MGMDLDDLFKQFDGNTWRWEGWREQQNYAGKALGTRFPIATRVVPWVFRIVAWLGWLLFFTIGVPWAARQVWAGLTVLGGWLGPIMLISASTATYAIAAVVLWRSVLKWSVPFGSSVYASMCASAFLLIIFLIGVVL